MFSSDSFTMDEFLFRVIRLCFSYIPHLAHIFCLFATVYLFANILKKKDCTGISGETQILYSLAFTTRYLSTKFINEPMMLNIPLGVVQRIYLLIPCINVLPIYFFYHSSNQSYYDLFRFKCLILLCIVLSTFANYGFEIEDMLRTFSVYLEAVAIVPQLHFCLKLNKIESIIHNYIVLMTLYKFFNVLNELGLYFIYPEDCDRISLNAGLFQIMFYITLFSFKKTKYTKFDAEVENEMSDIILHPKEVEAIRSSADSTARIAEKRSLFDTNEIILTPSQLLVGSVPQHDNKAFTIPTTEKEENNKTQLDLPVPVHVFTKSNLK